MTLVAFFAFVGRYGSCLHEKLHEELKRKPTFREKIDRYIYAFIHMERIRGKVTNCLKTC